MSYRRLYTDCYNALESSAHSAIDAAVLGGISKIGKKVGHTIAATKVGEKTQIDEALESAGSNIGHLNDDFSKKLVVKLQAAKEPNVALFTQLVEKFDELYNRPKKLAVDADNVYIIAA